MRSVEDVGYRVSSRNHDVEITGIGELERDELPRLGDPVAANAVAVRRAAADAGIALDEIDVLFTYDSLVSPHFMQATKVAEYLGIAPAYATILSAGGATPQYAIALGAALIRQGQARNVAFAHSDFRSRGSRSTETIARMANVVGNPEFEAPIGAILPTYYSMFASWLLDRSPLDRSDLAEVAVAARRWALLNPNALMTSELSAEDVLGAPLISGPLGRYDCCLITDFAGAFIVSPKLRDAGTGRGVAVAGVGAFVSHEEITQMPADPLLPAVRTAERLFDDAGMGPEALDIAYLYDSFTISVVLQLIAYGFADAAGVQALLAAGIGPGGSLPVNTHGGLLSATTGGVFHLIEAVRQLRGEAGRRQVIDAATALVTGVGGLMSQHCAVILQRGQDA